MSHSSMTTPLSSTWPRRAATLALAAAGLTAILPLLAALGGIFWNDGRFTLEPLAAAFSAPGRLASLAGTTAIVTLGTVAVALLLGAPLGFLIFRTDLPGRHSLRFACLLAACLPIYVVSSCWLALTGLPFWLYSPLGAAWLGGIAYTPLVTLIAGVAFASGTRELEDLARQDAAWPRVLRHAVLPQSLGSLAMAAAVVAALSLWDITITDMLMVRTFAEEVFTQFQLGAGPARAVAVCLPTVAVSLVVWAALARALRRYGEPGDASHVTPLATIRLGRARPALTAGVWLLVGALFVLPLAALVHAVSSVRQMLMAWHATSPELLDTLRVTPLAATLTTLLALGAAWTTLHSRRAAPWLIAAAWFLIAVPGPALGIGLIRILNRPGLLGAFYDTEGPLIAAYVLRAFPFAWLILLPTLRRIPRDLLDSAALDGSSWWRALVSVVMPLAWRGLAAAWLLSFVLSLAELGASFLVVPPGHNTLTVRFFTLIHYGVYPDAAGLCLLLLALVGLPAALLACLARPALVQRGTGGPR